MKNSVFDTEESHPFFLRVILARNDLPSRALTILFSVGNADCLLVAIQTAPEISKVRLFLIFFQIKRMDFFLVCCLIDFQLNNAECFFIDKATERGDAVASLSEVNAVRWENRQVI